MTDDRPAPSLGEILGDLPPLPDTVWERTLATALDPDAVVDADLVPEMTDVPVVPEDDEIELSDLLLDDSLLDDDADHFDHSSLTPSHTADHHADQNRHADRDHPEHPSDVELDAGLDPFEPLDGPEQSASPEHHVDYDEPDLDPGLGDDVS